MSNSEPKLTFTFMTCRADGCEAKLGFGDISSRCVFHRILHDAAWLSGDQLADLKTQLADVEPLPEKTRRKIRRDRALRTLETDAWSAAGHVDSARALGATAAQIAAAQRRGAESRRSA